MPDNVTADPGSGGADFATDDISGVHYPRNKIVIGADGTNDGDVSAANPLPTDVISALPAGTNAIGKLAANSGVDIGDVDVTSTVPGVGATNLGKAVDTAAGGADTGVASLAVRDDVLSTLTPADGDYVPLKTTDRGALWTHGAPNHVDSNNSSTSVLGAGATFTGTGKEVLEYETITILIDASHDSATDGMTFQFSTDDTNWDSINPFTLTASEMARKFTFATRGRYFRVVYTNGGTLQTHFRLQTILHHGATLTSIHRLVDDTSPDRSATLVKAALIAQAAGTGDFTPVQTTTGGNLKTSLEEIDAAVLGGGVEADALLVTLPTDGAINPGTAAADLGKAEDAVHGSGDTGVMALAVRSDVPTVAGADGDYVPILTNDEGAVWTHDTPNTVDSGNSTTTPLGSGATFTGTGIDVLGWAAITINLDSTHDSATDGMMFQFSQDDTNWDQIHNFTYTAANGGRSFQFSAHAQYFRVVYINGGTLQTTFRVQTILHHTAPITTIHRLVDSTDPDRSSTIQKSVTIAQAAGSGDFVPVQATAAGNFKMSVEEFDAGASLPAGSALIGDVGIGVRTSGGTTLYKNIDVDESEDQVKGTAGQVYWIHAVNLTAVPLFLKFYNATAASVTVGTTVPDLTFPVPANADSDGAGFTLSIPNGIAFGTAITIAGTLLLADNDATSPGASVLIVNLGYA